jgi:hypothetical protein
MDIKEVFEQAQKENKQVWNVTVLKPSGKYYCTEKPIIASSHALYTEVIPEVTKKHKKHWLDRGFFIILHYLDGDIDGGLSHLLLPTEDTIKEELQLEEEKTKS